AKPLDHEGTGSYTLTVTARDDADTPLTDEATVTLTVTDVNEAPAFAQDRYTRNVAENTAANTAVVTVSATDEDDTDTPTYEITSGNTGDVFAIDARSGQITIAAGKSLNHEDTETYTLTVTAADDADTPLTAEATVTVTVTDVNEAPKFANAAYMQNVTENTAVDAVVVTVSATDEDDTDTPIYSITNGNDNGDFAINENGQITIAKPLDHEGTGSYTLTVTARDDADTPLTAEAMVTVTVTDVNEAPTMFVNGSVIFSIAEDAAQNSNVGLPITGADPDEDDMLTYTITGGNDGTVFAIDGSTGQITVAKALDHETKDEYRLTVMADDSNGGTTEATITVTVTDVNENAPMMTSAVAASVAENTPAGTAVLTVTADDADASATITYRISGGADRNSFSIDEDTGVLTFNTAPDFEMPGSADNDNAYEMEVTASDGPNSVTQTITINVNDVNEAPVFAESSVTFSIAEDAAIDANVGDEVTAADEDAEQHLTYSITAGNDNGDFAIDGNGQITVARPLDYETTPSYTLTVTAADDGAGTLSATATVNITVIDEPNDEVLGVPFAEGVELYPNPASDHFRLSGISDEWIGVSLIGMTGHLVRSYPLSKDGLYDVSGLSEGLFFVIIEGDEGRKSVGRLVIRK
ncbi:MAG: cadherin domain-containing protein, partial [Ekhidna sp.]|nr:cadherin domain-containing protein [Ekhidna sp.]